jgi:hypothetical protein
MLAGRGAIEQLKRPAGVAEQHQFSFAPLDQKVSY